MIGGDNLIKKALAISLSFVLMLLALTSCGGNKGQKVTCSMCNGLGQVKYYYGDGDNDYNLGPCTSCEKYAEELITKEDKAGEIRSWCADCWDEYDKIMGT